MTKQKQIKIGKQGEKQKENQNSYLLSEILFRSETNEDVNKKYELIKKINYDLENQLGLDRKEFKLAGVLILFNNLYLHYFKPFWKSEIQFFHF